MQNRNIKINRLEPDFMVLKKIGLRLKDIRLKQNITRKELAEKCMLSESTITRIEDGQPINLSAFIKILRMFGLLENINALIPEQSWENFDLYKDPKIRKRASKHESRN